MIRALLTGRKNQTRRLARSEERCPFGTAGDRLWVRERWAQTSSGYQYAADISHGKLRFRPTFHMPRAACRIQLIIRAIDRERLQTISSRDARGEGFDADTGHSSARRWFAELWDRIYTAPGARWEDDPLVWVVRFEVTIEPRTLVRWSCPPARSDHRSASGLESAAWFRLC
jgi:hypothetical protein